MIKSFIVTVTVLFSFNVFAAQTDRNCSSMESAHRKATAALLQPINTSATNKIIQKILKDIELGMAFGGCDVSELGVAAKNTSINIEEDSTFYCLEKTVTKNLVNEADKNLVDAVKAFGGYRALAQKQTSELVKSLTNNIESDKNCQ